MSQADSITVTHGNLVVDVPRKLFKGVECVLDEEAAIPFRKMLRGRYPWLKEGSLDVLLKKARQEMIRVRDEETHGRSHSKALAGNGKIGLAIKHLEKRLELEPDDADSWYKLGEYLCQVGRVEEGYRAMNKGRALFDSKPKSRDRRTL
jgi:tetratricopeptide (TPR) repeat protein